MGEIQPRALIVTVYGLYARAADNDGWLPVGGLVRLLADLGVDEPAVRSAISRLKRRGVLVPARRNGGNGRGGGNGRDRGNGRGPAGTAGYALSDAGREILREGDERIFALPRARLADGWLLAVFSVPESERAKRHTLRSRLAALGFGTAAPGVWIAPAHRYAAARALLDRLGLTSYVDLFRADHLAFGDLAAAVKQWWDLDAVRAEYERFLAAPARLREPALPAWVRVVTEWRRLPYLDPGLPPDLLPADWPGTRAAQRFARLRETFEKAAARQARTLLRASARRSLD